MTGIVYCLENPAMPDLVKIGKTTNLERRLRELDRHTGVPVPFECVMAVEVDDAGKVEQLLHEVFDAQRIRKNREFFRVGVEHVRAAMQLTGGLEVTPRDDVVEDEEARRALEQARVRRGRFNFDMVGIAAGAELQFRYSDITDEGEEPFTAVVVSRNRIAFEGEETSLSGAARSILQRNGRSIWTPQGPLYWYFEGESLDERRRRMEEEGAE